MVALVFGVIVAQGPAYTALSSRGLTADYWAEYTDCWNFCACRFTRNSPTKR